MRHVDAFVLVSVWAVAGCGGGSGPVDGGLQDGGQPTATSSSSGGASQAFADCRDACNITQDRCLAAACTNTSTVYVCKANSCDYDNTVCVAGCPSP